MKFVVLAPEGMLGHAWVELLKQQGLPVLATGLPDVDITKRETLDPILGETDVVVNCAAWTDVDGAETREAEANVVNGEAVATLSAACAAHDALLVHYSTDYVFAGNATSPYPIGSPIHPVNAYGRSKALGERALAEGPARHLLIRTSWVYAPWGKNFVRTMASLGRSRETLSVVNDQRGRPTSAEHLARTSLALLREKAEGTYHVTDGGECTWFDFATHIVGKVNPDCRVEPCTSDAFPRPAPRPSYSVLDLSKTEALIGPMPDWTANVDAVLSKLDT